MLSNVLSNVSVTVGKLSASVLETAENLYCALGLLARCSCRAYLRSVASTAQAPEIACCLCLVYMVSTWYGHVVCMLFIAADSNTAFGSILHAAYGAQTVLAGC